MRRSPCCFLALVFVLPIAAIQGQEGKQAKRPSLADALKLGQPGAEHKKLAQYAGEWEAIVKMGGGNAARVYSGTAKNRMLAGGRFLEIEYQTKGPTESLEGAFLVGFDGRHQRFALVALDSFGTYFVTSQGKRNDETGKARLLGTDDDPQMKAMGFTKEFAHVLNFSGDDEFTIEVLLIDTRTAERREIKFMEYQFKRKRAQP